MIEELGGVREEEGAWTVRQGGPLPLWDTIERTLIAWQDAGAPDITEVRLHLTQEAHTYWIEGHPELCRQHRVL
ncbi:hypothetical protein [Streptomyces sp. SUK 48]|uniref:hypothetical protein n=1 Tax=Streptomyces sp. SUK 48 TaxID=2582831 RepID=UPI001891B079